jgi:hypothetical protein
VLEVNSRLEEIELGNHLGKQNSLEVWVPYLWGLFFIVLRSDDLSCPRIEAASCSVPLFIFQSSNLFIFFKH